MSLADQIEADLLERITRRKTLPCRLRLEPLAAHYGTSTRPVREAMARLRTRGVLDDRKALAALRIEPAEPARAPAAAEGSSADGLFRAMTNSLVERSFRGEETFLRESQVAGQFGVSTTVVREQFNRLVGSGLLEHVPRRGWRLRPLRQKDLDDFIQIRQAMEVLALQLAWDKLDLRRIAEYLEGNTPAKERRRAPRVDNDFHRYIIDTADNAYLTDFFDRHGRYFHLLFEWEDQTPAITADSAAQHRRVLQAILDRDLPAAEAALRLHILDNHPILTRMLAKQRGKRRPLP